MVPAANTTEYEMLSADLAVEPGLGRTNSSQALWQLAALGATIGIAIVGGVITGERTCQEMAHSLWPGEF